MKVFRSMLMLACLILGGLRAQGSDELVAIPASSHEIIDAATQKRKLTVWISEFQIGKTEVTQEQYEAIVGANPSQYRGKNRPVESVSWSDAIRYCNLRSEKEGLKPCYDLETGACDFSRDGYRLPTQWEWKVACAGADAKLDPTKANIGLASTRDGRAMMALVHDKGTKPVGSYPPNKHGLYDMAGNVWEWCYDYYDEVENRPEPSVIDPTGRAWGPERTIRGGSFLSTPLLYHSELHGRSSLRPDRRSRFTGFRVCRSTANRGKRPKPTYGAEWFEPFNQVPKGLEGRGNLPSLLVDNDGQAITTLAGWKKRRSEIRERWLKRLAIPPKPEKPPEIKGLKLLDGGCYTGELKYLEWGPGLDVKIVLMRPKKPIRRPTPAVIVHWYDVDAAVGKNLGGHLQQDLTRLKDYGRMMTQEGYVVVAVKWWDRGGESYEESMAHVKLHFPDCTGLGHTVWVTSRIVDYLETLPEVDHERIGCVGHCMAGIQTIYSAAFEERIRVAVAVGSNCSVFQSNYWDYWYLGDDVLKTIKPATDQQELFALCAPRAFLLDLGKGNYLDPCWPYINTAKEVYQLYGKPEYLGFFADRKVRPPSAPMVEAMRAWLLRFLNE